MQVKTFHLSPNVNWPSCKAEIPIVTSYLQVSLFTLKLRWEVMESVQTFRAECAADGDPCWQDSCVEVFIMALDGSGDYCNFEFTPRGFCLAARGPDRNQRTLRTSSEYSFIKRNVSSPCRILGDRCAWSLEVEIPGTLLGLSESAAIVGDDLVGNLYKCGDKTQAPHWLSAFPITTSMPDFHRPEFFQKLF